MVIIGFIHYWFLLLNQIFLVQLCINFVSLFDFCVVHIIFVLLIIKTPPGTPSGCPPATASCGRPAGPTCSGESTTTPSPLI